MKKTAVCFSPGGEKLIRKLNEACRDRNLETFEAYRAGDMADSAEGFIPVNCSIEEWTGKMFLPGSALIFVGAVGIAVRAIAGYVRDKLTDCPVIVIDDCGQFVIPILSGHAGGAGKLAIVIAELLDAVPVITTATDINEAFSVDSFAAENRLTIANRDGIKKVSARALEGRKVTLSIKDFPPKEKVDVLVADETDAEYTLLLKPKKYVVGLGMKRDKDSDALEGFFLEILDKCGIEVADVYALCTIDKKEDEKALTGLRDKYRIPVISFDKELLGRAEGEFTGSEFVRETVGVDNVCERAAMMGAGPGGELILGKTARDGMTIAIAKRA